MSAAARSSLTGWSNARLASAGSRSPIGEEEALCTELQRWAGRVYGYGERVRRSGNSLVVAGDGGIAPRARRSPGHGAFFADDGPAASRATGFMARERAT